MSLLDRVTTLIRANLNDLIDKAEDPEKLLKQLLLDMQNQYLQLKTQTAASITEQHLLENKRAENAKQQGEWLSRAEVAMTHQDEASARAAIARALHHESAASGFAQQAEQHATQTASLRECLSRLEEKIAETRTQADLLLARHRSARIAQQTGLSNRAGTGQDHLLDRVRMRTAEAEAAGQGFAVFSEQDLRSKIDKLESNSKIDDVLAEIKRRQGRP